MHEKFHYKTLDEVKRTAAALGVSLPFAADTHKLAEPLRVKTHIFPNRLGIAPMEGADSLQDGSPSEYTARRYLREAKGGSAIIWFEAISIVPEGRSSATQLYLCRENLDSYKRLTQAVKEAGFRENGFAPYLVMQANHSGRYSNPGNKPAPMIAYRHPELEQYRAADDSCIVTDEYYKLTLSGSEGDSVREMAQTLFDGQCVDGDTALCEAALSAPCFLKLAELGVEFPRNRYGEYVGYKTDHDPRRRATSAGPYTSKRMTQVLEHAVFAQDIPMLDGMQVIRILTNGEQILGLLCLNRAAHSENARYTLVHCRNVIWATGGPAGIYADSVYPLGHNGATGIALEAGAAGQNLTEWQYGLASLHPRWNVSGTYMQVLPCVISTAPDQTDEREFLMDFFKTPADMLTKLFLKGYQWPFDVKKIAAGSSIIDILVYLERCKGRRVWLDFRRNPCSSKIDFSQLGAEAREYLTCAGACFGTPIERLRHMNAPAVEFYREHGVDLEEQPLEIALCAQHNNGGLAVDCWWQTNIKGLFAVGEAAGTHGVCRPGGTALNAGQVGSLRAAEYISRRCTGAPPADFTAAAVEALTWANAFSAQILCGESNLDALRTTAQLRMSRCGGAIRRGTDIALYQQAVTHTLHTLNRTLHIASPEELPAAYRLRDLLLAQQAYLFPQTDDFFENVWRSYRETGNVD